MENLEPWFFLTLIKPKLVDDIKLRVRKEGGRRGVPLRTARWEKEV